jgi:hypothetical protein
MNRAFSVAMVEADETTFNTSHVREDMVVFDLSLTQSEGDFCNLEIELENPRVGILAPGRPRWVWIAWNPNFDPFASESSEAVFEDMVPLFFGRVQGVPSDFIGETIRLNFLARPLDFNTQKEALADTLRVAPWFDGVWFGPDDRFLADNVLESRSALWHIDRVTHEVTTSNIITGEDGTITVTGGDVLEDSIRISYGDPPCRQVNVTANISWDQTANGEVWIIGGPGATLGAPGSSGVSGSIATYTGAGLQKNWPKSGQNIGGDWEVKSSYCERVDDRGRDAWTYGGILHIFNQANRGKNVYVATWEVPQYVLGTFFEGHVLSIKEWKLGAGLSVGFASKRGRSETVTFSLRSDTQSLLTDSTDGEAVDLKFSSSEVAASIGVFSDGSIDLPIGKPWANRYITTDRGQTSLEYLILVARARLLASARCVDVTFEIPWSMAIAEGVNLRKNVVISDSSLPGGVVGGKIKSYAFRANGDSGAFTCEITIGATIGRGGTITGDPGAPTYVVEGYVDEGYQVYVGGFVMPVAGEVAYSPINGFPVDDDGIDFDRMIPSRILAQPVLITNQSDVQEPLIKDADEPRLVYDAINTAQTTVSFELKPLNNGPFAQAYEIETTVLAVPKTIDLEAELDSSS